MPWTGSTCEPEIAATLWDYLERAAYFMVNAADDPASGV